MESTEDIQKYISMAQSLSLEARNLPEMNEDSSLQQMGALLASNCQKLCIGPSFHFYTAENPQRLSEQLVEEEGASVTEIPEEDEYETIIYRGPDKPFEVEGEDVNPRKYLQQKLKVSPMQLNLAEAAAQHGGLLSPQFFLQNMSPEDSTRDVGSTSVKEHEHSLYSVNPDGRPMKNDKSLEKPFTYPKVVPNPGANEESSMMSSEDIVQRLERVELLEDNSNDNEIEWVEWPKKFIERNGFCLGIQPGDFYKEVSRPYFYVKLPHRCKCEVLVTNRNQVPCDLDLYVNGKLIFALRIPEGATRSIDGPQYSEYAFKSFRAEEAPSGNKVKVGDSDNGVVKAVFTPLKIASAKFRTVSEPCADTQEFDILDLFEDSRNANKNRAFSVPSGGENEAERSFDISQVGEAVVLLQGERKKRNYVAAPEMETDLSKQVILQLRLIASLEEEHDATKEDIYDLEPPPLPKKK